MLRFESLGLTEAMGAISVAQVEAERRGHLMSFAVADSAGALIACLRMDGAPARTLTHAIRKAYSAAEMGRDTSRFARDLEERGGNLEQWGNSQLTTLTGGCVVMRGEAVLGAVACGGAPTAEDEAIARMMVAAALA